MAGSPSKRSHCSASSAAVIPPWTELPMDLTANILSRLPVEDIMENAQVVCTNWYQACKDPSLWKKLHLTVFQNEMMCRNMIERSQGQLRELKLTGMDLDSGLLDFASERSPRLKSLSLILCLDWDAVKLLQAVRRLPLLEELSVYYNIKICGESIRLLGRSCPMLESLTYETFSASSLRENQPDKELIAIADSMPRLRSLRISGFLISAAGLAAISARCPQIELIGFGDSVLV